MQTTSESRSHQGVSLPAWVAANVADRSGRNDALVQCIARFLTTAEKINTLGCDKGARTLQNQTGTVVDLKADKLVQDIQAARSAWSHLSTGTSDWEQRLTGLNPFIELFNSMTDRLTNAYDQLEERVNRLTSELTDEIERRQQELEAREMASRRLQSLLHLLPAGVVLIDGQGLIQMCNAAAIDLLGEPLEGEKWLDVIQRCFAPRKDDGHEVSLKDGRRVSISLRSIDQEPGQLILLSDLTETRDLQARLSRYERLSAMGRMVASLAHQIRTPLSTAMLYAGHLAQPELADVMRVKCADKLMSRLVHLEQQVRDMLIFAKGETPLAERVSLGQFEHAFRHALEGVVSRSGAHISWRNEAKSVEILCNQEALVGACLNLVNNSIEAVNGRADIAVTMAVTAEHSVAITIRDNGSGFSPGAETKLKEAFYTTKPQGTGLGLPVVMAVAKAHKGTFDIQSTETGAIARIVMPRAN